MMITTTVQTYGRLDPIVAVIVTLDDGDTSYCESNLWGLLRAGQSIQFRDNEAFRNWIRSLARTFDQEDEAKDRFGGPTWNDEGPTDYDPDEEAQAELAEMQDGRYI